MTQDLLRNWFSPTFEVDLAGNRAIEAEVVEKVASYGKQLGILTEALLEVAGKRDGDSLARLERLAADIEALKARHKEDLLEDARRSLESLKRADRAAFERLLEAYKG